MLPRTVLITAGLRAFTVCLLCKNSSVRYWNISSLSVGVTNPVVYLMMVIQVKKRKREIWCLINLFLKCWQLWFQCHPQEKIQGRDKSAFLVWVPAANLEENKSHSSMTTLRLMSCRLQQSLSWRWSIGQGKQITRPLFTWGHISPLK